FRNTVVAQFFGHTHSEEFYITYEDPQSSSSRPTSVVYSAPSITPYSEYFPAYRIYSIDGAYNGSTYRSTLCYITTKLMLQQVIDFEEWFLNLTEANANPRSPHWQQLYASANQEYGLKSQSPSEWNDMIERMRTDNVLFEKYRQSISSIFKDEIGTQCVKLRNYYRRSKFDGIGDCDEKCKNGWLCSARQMHHSKALCADLNCKLHTIDAIYSLDASLFTTKTFVYFKLSLKDVAGIAIVVIRTLSILPKKKFNSLLIKEGIELKLTTSAGCNP
ncbi:unnamed protein product, partial [Angiostrongylus costaricensis]|uniref:Metallophos domain-containing protein n=1 Tax=Angiostrongylus costaricensis TaxID=334426 RepID=A0A0R3PGD1_ANGCS